jgi:hypothetical protein
LLFSIRDGVKQIPSLEVISTRDVRWVPQCTHALEGVANEVPEHTVYIK